MEAGRMVPDAWPCTERVAPIKKVTGKGVSPGESQGSARVGSYPVGSSVTQWLRERA